MRRIALLILIGLVLSSSVAIGQEIYRWVDEKGTVHFTDDLTLVPQKYRDQIQKRRFPEQPSPSPAITQSQTESTEPMSVQKDLLGRGEEWWRAKMNEADDKLQEAQKNYDLTHSNLRQKEKELSDAKFKPDSIKRRLKAEIRKLEEKLKEQEKERDEAKNMLEKVLPREAEDFRADPAWLKFRE